VANGAKLGWSANPAAQEVTRWPSGPRCRSKAPKSPARPFDGFDLLEVPTDLRDLRGTRLAMIFQELLPRSIPSFTIGEQIIETILRHRGGSRGKARERASNYCGTSTSLPERGSTNTHKAPGGMRQALIAMRWPAIRCC